MPKVFISYARVDAQFVDELEQHLTTHGVQVWRDQHSLYGGQQWPKAIGEAIADCAAVLLLWSTNSARSHFVEFEWTAALALKKPIIPCLLDETALPPALAAINAIACRQPAAALPKILAALPDQPPPHQIERRAQVITQLQRVTATASDEALNQAKRFFHQSGLIVGGDVIINQGWVIATALAAVVIVALTALYFGSRPPPPPPPLTAPAPTSEQGPHLTGQVEVDDDTNTAIPGAMVKITEINGRILTEAERIETTTAGNGGFTIENIPGRIEDSIRVHISKQGYQAHDANYALGQALTIRLEKER